MRAASLAILAVLSAVPAAAQERGWHTYDLGSGRRATRFLPSAVRTCDALPLAIFLHGAGGTPEAYHTHLEAHAEALGMVLLLPQASGAGWSGADTGAIDAALGATVADGIRIDETRTYLAGHSAGGAFAYILAYDGSTGFAAVFSMSAPFYAVGSLSDPMHRAPIHMYYGADDPNYTGGSASMLEAQWTALGLLHETDVQTGYGHSTWPASSIRAGFDFLLAHPYPGTPTASTCGDPDAGAVDAGAAAVDAGAVSSLDGAVAVDAGGRADGGGIDGGRPGRTIAAGCGCRAGGRRGDVAIVLVLAFALAGRVRRGRQPRPAPGRPAPGRAPSPGGSRAARTRASRAP